MRGLSDILKSRLKKREIKNNLVSGGPIRLLLMPSLRCGEHWKRTRVREKW